MTEPKLPMEDLLYIVKGTDECGCGEVFGFLQLDNAAQHCLQNELPQTAIIEATWTEGVPLSESHERWRLVMLPAHDHSRPLVFFRDSPAVRGHFLSLDQTTQERILSFPKLRDAVHLEPKEEEDPIFIP